MNQQTTHRSTQATKLSTPLESAFVILCVIVSVIAAYLFFHFDTVRWSHPTIEHVSTILIAGLIFTALSYFLRVSLFVLTIAFPVLLWFSLGFSAEILAVCLFWGSCLGFGLIGIRAMRWKLVSFPIIICLGYLVITLALTVLAYTPLNTKLVFIIIFLAPALWALINFRTELRLSIAETQLDLKTPVWLTFIARLIYFISLSLIIFNTSLPEMGSDAVGAYRPILVEILAKGSFDYSPEISTIRLLPLSGIWPQSFAVVMAESVMAAKIMNGSVLVMVFLCALASSRKPVVMMITIGVLASLPILSFTTTSAFYDNSVVFLMTGLICLVEYMRQSEALNPQSVFVLGLFIGLMILTKYTTLFLALPIAVLVLWRLNRAFNLMPVIKQALTIGAGVLCVWGSFLFFVFLQTGNPVFPFYSELFENPYLSRTLTSPHSGYFSFNILWDLTYETASYAETNAKNGALGLLVLVLLVPALLGLISKDFRNSKRSTLIYAVTAFAAILFVSYFQNSVRYLLIAIPFFALPWFNLGDFMKSRNGMIGFTVMSVIIFSANLYNFPNGGYLKLENGGIFAKTHSEIQSRRLPLIPVSDQLSRDYGTSGNVLFMEKEGGFVGRSYIVSWYNSSTQEAFLGLNKRSGADVDDFLKSRSLDAIVASDKALRGQYFQNPEFKNILQERTAGVSRLSDMNIIRLSPEIAFKEQELIEEAAQRNGDVLVNLTGVTDIAISFEYRCTGDASFRFFEIRESGTWEYSKPLRLTCDGIQNRFESSFRALDPGRRYRISATVKKNATLELVGGKNYWR